jgi:exosortase/archaeosortase family protein
MATVAQTIAKQNRVIALPALNGNALLAACVVACWPVWFWCAERMRDKSDDPLGLVALAAVAFLTLGAKGGSPSLARDGRYGSACAFLLIYALTAGQLPMLIRAGFAVTAIALLLSSEVSMWGLMLLGLPVMATMQFYLGYPLRLLVTHAVQVLMSIAGYAVQIRGTDLLWDTHIIGIDPACSGVKMLWTAFFVCFVSAPINKLNNKRTVFLSVATLGIALAANVFRACLLFMLEVLQARMGIVAPDFVHPGIGVLMFAFVVVSIVAVAGWLGKDTGGPRNRFAVSRAAPTDAVAAPTSIYRIAFALAIAVAALAPYLIPAQTATKVTSKIEMPASFEGHSLTAIPLTAAESEFSASFPGQIGKFTDGKRQYIIRIVSEPTRQLHPAEDCFRGIGYKTRSTPNIRDAQNQTWGSFEASNEEMKLSVRERISDNGANAWSDVSSWYWSAILGKTHGPWQAVTIAEIVR